MNKTLEATSDDVRYAYRLLLGREPDPDGFRHHLKSLRSGTIRTSDLVQIFMNSDEYLGNRSRSGELREVVIDGVKIFPWRGDSLIGDNLGENSPYEPNVLPVFLESLSSGYCVLDVGANVGIFSLQAARRVGPKGMVYCIEPVARNVRSLSAGIRANGFDNVSLIPVAASDRHSVVAVLRQDDSSNGIVDYGVSDTNSLDFVPTQRLDFLLHGISRLDVVKIDIEGHEPIAWKGMRSLVERFRPLIFSEFSPVAIRNHSRVDPETYLEDLLKVATQPIEVLSRDGQRIRCASAMEIMSAWRDANARAGLGGELHLDLLIHTETSR